MIKYISSVKTLWNYLQEATMLHRYKLSQDSYHWLKRNYCPDSALFEQIPGLKEASKHELGTNFFLPKQINDKEMEPWVDIMKTLPVKN